MTKQSSINEIATNSSSFRNDGGLENCLEGTVLYPSAVFCYSALMTKYQKRFYIILSEIVLLFVVIGVSALLLYTRAIPMSKLSLEKMMPTTTPTPTPFVTYHVPQIPTKDYYKIVMVGDSMTEVLGIHGGKLSEDLNSLFQSTPGHQKILIDNYAVGSKSLLELTGMMTGKVTNPNDSLEPLLSTQFDMILIESFGYNPLSQLGLENGQKEQTKILQQNVELLLRTHPNAVIVFVATIAPNKATYAKEVVVQSLEGRAAEAQERMDYIQNHMKYAKAHNIPLIDIYDKSLTQNGDGNLLYINPSDHIHPSFAGIDFISSEIANWIYNSQILPK